MADNKFHKFCAEHKIFDNITKNANDWGIGQSDINTILAMLTLKQKYNLSFTFTKSVTAFDNNQSFESITIEAKENCLFVFVSPRGNLTNFWKEVESIRKETEDI